MGRTGITFTEVDNAARYLQGQGVKPTVDAIRARLGTGSRTTLSEYLKRWKSLQADATGQLPQPLLALVTGLWESLQAQADKQVQENQVIAHQELTAMRTQYQTTLQAHEATQQALHQSQEAFDALQREKSGLEQQLQALEKTQGKLTLLYEAALKQNQDAKEENRRLHKLTEQVQANLEHYQQAIQQQQLEQNLEREKQQSIYVQELSTLKILLDEARQRYETSEKALAVQIAQLQQAQENHTELVSRYENLLAENQSTTRELMQSLANAASSQKQLEQVLQTLTLERQHNQSLHGQVAVLTDQLQRSQTELQTAVDKIEILRQEKLFLVQEKAQLDGAFRQLHSLPSKA